MPLTLSKEQLDAQIELIKQTTGLNPLSPNVIGEYLRIVVQFLDERAKLSEEFVTETNSTTFIQDSLAQVEIFANNASTSVADAEAKRAATELLLGNTQGVYHATETIFNETKALKDDILLAENPLGDYNAATNNPALTGIPPAGVPNGSFYTVTEPGPVGFAGSNFLSGTAAAIGGRFVKKSNTEWFYQKPSDAALLKVGTLEPQISTLQKQNIKLLPVTSFPAVIKQQPTNAYSVFQNQSQKEVRGWFFAKSVKTLDRIGVFIFKRSSSGTISANVRVQALHKRGSVVTKMVDKIIPFAELAANDDIDVIAAGTQSNFEYMVDLTTPVTLVIGDTFFVSVHCESGLYPLYTEDNKALASGEWNNGVGFYYRSWSNTAEIAFTDIPVLPAAEVNPMAFNFYEKAVELNRVKQLEDRAGALEAGKATVTTLTVIGNQKFNKAAYVVAGKGIGNDAVVFNAAAFGAMMDQPVKELTTYIFSGLNASGGGRGLRFQRSNGTLISFLPNIANATPFATPAETATISVQLWASTNPGAADLVMLNEGNTVLPLEAYSSVAYVNKGNGLGFQAESLVPATKMGGSQVATFADLDPAKARITALEAVVPLGATDFTYLSPPIVFVADNEIGGFTARKEAVLLHLQRFIREKKEIWLNTAKNFVVIAKNAINSASVVQENIQFTLGGGHFQTKAVTVNRVSVNTNVLAAQFPKVGYIGDSITSNRTKNGSSLFGSGCMYGMAKEMAIKNNVDNALAGYNYLLVGKTNQGTVSTAYKGNTYAIRQYADGYGGWAASTWLRHPIRMWVYPAGGWDLLGLVTTQGRAYSASTEDKVLMTKTCYGVNAPVISANSYATLVSEQAIANLGAWTGSAPQTAAVQAWIDSVAANGPSNQNQYLDLAKSGTNRFSIAKYLASWRTLAADGVTRLVVGSTAGSKVVTATDHDVCEPTHIVICLGENDSLFHSNYVEIVNDIMELASEITTQLPSCHVAICLTGIPGPMFPDRHPNYIGLFDQNHHNRKFDLMKELQTRFGNLASQVANRIYLLPTYFAGTPLSHSNVSEQIDEGSGQLITIANDDYNHPGYYANRSAGSQIYGWVAYTKTL